MLIRENLAQILIFPDTPSQTPEEYLPPPPPPLFDYEKDFPPLSTEPVEAPLVEPRETSLLLSDGSLSSLKNKLPTLPPLPSKPSVDDFSRPITQITDEKNNTISITPKKPVLPSI